MVHFLQSHSWDGHKNGSAGEPNPKDSSLQVVNPRKILGEAEINL
ncbi:MAG: hypothetical protein SNH35_08160 [Rikenellaceae bacterium]